MWSLDTTYLPPRSSFNELFIWASHLTCGLSCEPVHLGAFLNSEEARPLQSGPDGLTSGTDQAPGAGSHKLLYALVFLLAAFCLNSYLQWLLAALDSFPLACSCSVHLYLSGFPAASLMYFLLFGFLVHSFSNFPFSLMSLPHWNFILALRCPSW